MTKLWFPRSVVLLALIGAPAPFLSAQTAPTALPGTVNYVEGRVSIDGNPLNQRQNGNTQVQPNQSLITANGKAEMLLSPGVFVRAGSNSEIRLVSAGLVAPTIEIVRGQDTAGEQIWRAAEVSGDADLLALEVLGRFQV